MCFCTAVNFFVKIDVSVIIIVIKSYNLSILVLESALAIKNPYRLTAKKNKQIQQNLEYTLLKTEIMGLSS